MLKCFTGGTGTNLILNYMFTLYDLFTLTDYCNFSQYFAITQSHMPCILLWDADLFILPPLNIHRVVSRGDLLTVS